MQIWEESSKFTTRRLLTIGETRWWAKDAALSKIFGSINNHRDALYVDLILALDNIENSEQAASGARAKARSF